MSFDEKENEVLAVRAGEDPEVRAAAVWLKAKLQEHAVDGEIYCQHCGGSINLAELLVEYADRQRERAMENLRRLIW